VLSAKQVGADGIIAMAPDPKGMGDEPEALARW